MNRALALLLALVPAASLAAPPPPVAALRGHRRVLIVAAPTPGDPRLAEQRRALAGWRRGAADRDLTLVTVSRDSVQGTGDRAKMLRRQWHLPPDRFQVVLVGKDGHEALRARQPIAAAALERTIDAMPMRRAGRR